MENRSTEKLIQDALNAEKPDRRVLADAKEVMAQKHPVRINRLLRVWLPAACSFLLIAAGAALTVFNLFYPTENYAIANAAFEAAAGSKGLIVGVTLIAAGVLPGAAALIFGIKSKKR